MHARVSTPLSRTTSRGTTVHATLHLDGMTKRNTGEPIPFTGLLLDEANIDSLMDALEPIFEVRKRTRSLQQVRKRGLEQADQAQASLDAIQYPV